MPSTDDAVRPTRRFRVGQTVVVSDRSRSTLRGERVEITAYTWRPVTGRWTYFVAGHETAFPESVLEEIPAPNVAVAPTLRFDALDRPAPRYDIGEIVRITGEATVGGGQTIVIESRHYRSNTWVYTPTAMTRPPGTTGGWRESLVVPAETPTAAEPLPAGASTPLFEVGEQVRIRSGWTGAGSVVIIESRVWGNDAEEWDYHFTAATMPYGSSGPWDESALEAVITPADAPTPIFECGQRVLINNGSNAAGFVFTVATRALQFGIWVYFPTPDTRPPNTEGGWQANSLSLYVEEIPADATMPVFSVGQRVLINNEMLNAHGESFVVGRRNWDDLRWIYIPTNETRPLNTSGGFRESSLSAIVDVPVPAGATAPRFNLGDPVRITNEVANGYDHVFNVGAREWRRTVWHYTPTRNTRPPNTEGWWMESSLSPRGLASSRETVRPAPRLSRGDLITIVNEPGVSGAGYNGMVTSSTWSSAKMCWIYQIDIGGSSYWQERHLIKRGGKAMAMFKKRVEQGFAQPRAQFAAFEVRARQLGRAK